MFLCGLAWLGGMSYLPGIITGVEQVRSGCRADVLASAEAAG
jgi:hypothetical protein